MAFSSRFVGRSTGAVVCALILCSAHAALGIVRPPGSPAHPASVRRPLLPTAFAGWRAVSAAQTGTSAAVVDASRAAALHEFGLKDFAEAAYQRGGARMDVLALGFGDATGAYGAYTLYRQPDMKLVSIGRGAAANAREMIFWSGTTLVEATFPGPVAGGQAALRALAAALPPMSGERSVAPTLPGFLPAKGLDPASVRYAIGPATYAAEGGVLPPNLIRFDLDAEAVTAHYDVHGGDGVLTLLGFPTPQMAIAAEKSILALLKGPLPATLATSGSGTVAVKRSGPLVAVTSGAFSSADAQALLSRMKFQAKVTWSHVANPGETALHQTAEMLVGIGIIIGIALIIILVFGTMFGGGRALWRVMHGKPASSLYEQEFISLNLNGHEPGTPQKLP